MLKILRNKKTAKKIWIGLAIIIIPAFAFWGFGGSERTPEEKAIAGRLFGKNISYQEYKESLSAVRVQAVMQFGDNLPKLEKYLDLEAQAWERIILLYEAKRRNFQATDKEVVETIESAPYFQDKSGFSDKLYMQTLRYVLGVKPRTFEEQTRQNIILSKLYKQVTEGASVTAKEVRDDYEKTNQELSIFYIEAKTDDFAKKIKLTDSQVREYFDKNKALFKEPESFNIEYCAVTSESQNNALAALLTKKVPMEKAVKELGLSLTETGFFNLNSTVPGLGWPAESTGIFTKLKTGEYAPLIQANKTSYIIRLKEKRESYTPEFEKVKEKVKTQMVKETAAKLAEGKINECAKKISTMDFNKAAKKCGLKVKTSLPFKAASRVEGLGQTDIFWNTAKSLKAGQSSQLISQNDNFYLIKVKSITPVDEKKFLQERGALEDKLLTAKKQEKFNQLLNQLKQKAQ
jgi:peptidyl-prolyl cis-trans isomerase D